MDLYELISRLGLALGIGLLIGLERGWRRREAEPGSRAAGIRTFALSGLLGGVIAALAQALPKQESGGAASIAVVLGVAFAAYGAVIALFARDENQAAGNFSATTPDRIPASRRLDAGRFCSGRWRWADGGIRPPSRGRSRQ